MNENLKLRKSMPVYREHIDENTGEYVKQRTYKEETLGFYLRFCGKWFYPCKEDQERLKNLILNSDTLIIGNKDYLQPIELNMKFELPIKDEWMEIERRPATDKEKEKLEAW